MAEITARFGTPLYVYDWAAIERRATTLASTLGDLLALSYAVKANPNLALLGRLSGVLQHFDVSSVGEIERLRCVGVPLDRASFTGPGKRDFEIERAVFLGVGHIVCESIADLDRVSACALRLGRVQPVLLRINPLEVPPKFGAHMGGGASQFGIDEEVAPEILRRLDAWRGARVEGFHVYSGSNCLSVESLVRHFELTVQLFDRLAAALGEAPRTLVIGSGFGIAYHPGEQPLALDELVSRLRPLLIAARQRPRLAGARWVLEMGRYLVADAGWLITSVLSVKRSRGTNIGVLDAGFNNHLAAAGLMGSLLRRNWPIVALGGGEVDEEYTLVGPLCTSIDTLATRMRLPALSPGSLLAIGASGAYGFTASPTRFISHPEPREVLLHPDGTVCDVSEMIRLPRFDEQTVEGGPQTMPESHGSPS